MQKEATQSQDITKMSVEQLKALAYDELAKQQQATHNLKVLNEQINKLQTVKAEPVVEPVKK